MLCCKYNVYLQHNSFIIGTNKCRIMKKSNLLYRIWDLYYDGFSHLRWGKTLWIIILIKLFIIFVVLKIFFFPDFLKSKVPESQRANYVSTQITNRIKP